MATTALSLLTPQPGEAEACPVMARQIWKADSTWHLCTSHCSLTSRDKSVTLHSLYSHAGGPTPVTAGHWSCYENGTPASRGCGASQAPSQELLW